MMIQDALIWMSGHLPSHCRDLTPAERWALSRSGLFVLVAYIAASINFAVVGWVYTENVEGETRWIITALVMFVGSVVMVLLLDRSFLFLMDTAVPEKGVINGMRNLVFALFRIAVIVGFSAFTAQYTMPFYLSAELDVAALDMIEKRESNRIDNLASAAGLDDRKKSVESGDAIVDSWMQAIENAQKTLDSKKSASSNCWGRWDRSVRDNTSYEVSRETARTFAGPRSIARECSNFDAAVKVQGEELAKVSNNHQLAIGALTTAKSELDATNRQIAKTMAERGAIEQRALNGTSATVLNTALKNDPGIFAKWAMLTALQVGLELLPFLVKLFSGNSCNGARIAGQFYEEKDRIATRLEQVNSNRAVRQKIAATANVALIDAANSAELRLAFTEHLKSYMVALGPQEGVRTLMLELASNADDVREFASRYPQYAALIAEAWHRAIRESSESLSGFGKSLTEQLMGGRQGAIVDS